jgi:uncharacterized cofD-like protein
MVDAYCTMPCLRPATWPWTPNAAKMLLMRKIVTIGGGTGTFTVLQGLREYPFELSAVVSTADDGGSTGVLRDELGVLPPGDIRQALVALSPQSSVLRELFNYRFNDGGLKGHSFGNLFLSAMEKVTGSFDRAVLEAGRILSINGNVIPVTREPICLKAEMANGRVVHGEHAIEEFVWSEASPLQRLWLEPSCQLHPLAKAAIKSADLVVIAPGSIITSLIPNLLVEEMKDSLASTRAPIAYVVNLMTEKGHTGEYYVQDFVAMIEQYLGTRRIDYVIYNTRRPDAALLERYKKEMERSPVRLDRKRLHGLGYHLIGTDLLGRKPRTRAGISDTLASTRTLIRHDSAKLAEVLYALTVFKRVQKYFA